MAFCPKLTDVASRKELCEKAVQYTYFLSVALAPLGPAVHYSLWGLSALLLVCDLLVNHKPFLPEMPGDGKAILALLLALALWVFEASILTFTDLHSYGKNVTVPFELLVGAYMAARTLSTPSARDRFIKILAVTSFVILCGNVLRELDVVRYFPNRSLIQGNSLGALALLLFPPMACFTFWQLGGLFLKKFLFLLPLLAALTLSFSSGAWLSAVFGCLTFLCYAFKFHKISLKFILCAVALCYALCAGCYYSAPYSKLAERLTKRMTREIEQITAMRNVNKLTTGRNKIWEAACWMIRRRPLTGTGGDTFENQHNEYLKTLPKPKKNKKRPAAFPHPHSTYLYLAYIGGIPALVLFAAAMCACLKKALVLARSESSVYFPWAVMSLVFLIEILTYGTNGDVFQGRRDISAIVWCVIGIIAALPTSAVKGENENA